MFKLTPEQISKIKTYGLAIVLTLAIGLGTCTGYLAIKNNRTLKELALERDRYGILAAEKQRLDSLEVVRLATIKDRENQIAVLTDKYEWQRWQYSLLKDSIKTAVTNVDTVSSTADLNYINTTYPPIAEQIFPLDSSQIKMFHRISIELVGEKAINLNLLSSLNSCDSLRALSVDQTESYRNLYLERKQMVELVSKEKAIVEDQLEVSTKQVNKQKTLNFFQNSAIVGGAIAIVILLL